MSLISWKVRENESIERLLWVDDALILLSGLTPQAESHGPFCWREDSKGTSPSTPQKFDLETTLWILKAFFLLMGAMETISTTSPTSHTSSSSCAKNFLDFLTRFPYIGWATNLSTCTQAIDCLGCKVPMKRWCTILSLHCLSNSV